MPRFKAGQSGNPRGRPKGSRNKRSEELEKRLTDAMGADWCPIVAMAQMTLETDLKADLRARLLADIAPYVQPKVRHVVGDVEEETNLAEALQAARLRAQAANPPSYRVVGSLEPREPDAVIVTGVEGGLVGGQEDGQTAPVPPPRRAAIRLNLNEDDSQPEGAGYASADQYNPMDN